MPFSAHYVSRKNRMPPVATAKLPSAPSTQKRKNRKFQTRARASRIPLSRFDTALRRASQAAIPGARGDIRTDARLKA
jgi:hypothetical protein